MFDKIVLLCCFVVNNVTTCASIDAKSNFFLVYCMKIWRLLILWFGEKSQGSRASYAFISLESNVGWKQLSW